MTTEGDSSVLLDLPRDMLREVSTHLDPPSCVVLALTHPSFFSSLSTFNINFLRRSELLLNICDYGHLNLFNWYRNEVERPRKPLKWVHGFKAARSGNLELLVALKEQNVPIDEQTIVGAASMGHILILEHLLRFEKLPFTQQAYQALGESGSLKAMQWAEENTHFLSRLRPNMCTTYAMIGSVRSGNKDLIQYFNEYGKVKLVDHFFVEAAKAGQLELFEWMLKFDLSKVDWNNVVNDISSYPDAFLPVLKILFAKGLPFDKQVAMFCAIFCGDLEAAECIHSHSLDLVFEPHYAKGMFATVLANRNLECARFLVEKLKLNPGRQHVIDSVETGYHALPAYFETLPSVAEYLPKDWRIQEPSQLNMEITKFFVEAGVKSNCTALVKVFELGYSTKLMSYLVESRQCAYNTGTFLAALRTKSNTVFKKFARSVRLDPDIPVECRVLAEELGLDDLADWIAEKRRKMLRFDTDFFEKLQSDYKGEVEYYNENFLSESSGDSSEDSRFSDDLDGSDFGTDESEEESDNHVEF